MFDIGLQELIVIFVIALLVFGPKNLPQLGRSLGRAMREFRRASDEFRSTIETNLQMSEPDPPATTSDWSADGGATELASGSPPEIQAPDPQAEAPAAAGGEASPEAESHPGEPYVGGRGARLVHGRDCSWVRRITEPERMYFKTLADARDAGLVTCPACEPWEPA